MRDAIVVGCGIVGATVARHLAGSGLADVLALDDGRPLGGTAPSGGHLKVSWFGKLKKGEYEPAMETLDRTWGMSAEEFAARGGPTAVHRVDTDAVVRWRRESATLATALDLKHLDNYPEVFYREGGEVKSERTRLLVVATGYWAGELLQGLQVRGKQGVSFRVAGTLAGPLIEEWAPYKQVTAHQQAPGEVWAGDGSALLPDNWTAARTGECLARCLGVLKLGTPGAKVLRTLHGIRPYLPGRKDAAGSPCLLRKLHRRVWVATGAAKSGTIAAGWAATKIVKEVCGG